MKRSNLILVNLLIACMVGFIVIFPDITRKFGNDNNRRPPFEYPPSFESDVRENSRGRISPEEEVIAPWFSEEEGLRAPGFRPPQNILSTFFSFFILAAILLFINTRILFFNNDNRQKEWKKIAVSIILSLLLCLLFGLLTELFSKDPRKPFHLEGIKAFQMLSVWVITLLCGLIISLIYHRQQMRLENERLQNEKLQATYDVLIAQVNPHFLFNSLNTLSALVRERRHDVSLKYINEMSGIFRYVLDSNRKELVTLQQEINFLNAYRYMLEIRYADKLFFEIEVDDIYYNYLIPVLSFQPVIENVIKHNVISGSNPLTIKIFISDGKYLVISNPVFRKLSHIESSGIGLRNLNERYQLLLSEGIVFENNQRHFTVKLPVVPPLKTTP